MVVSTPAAPETVVGAVGAVGEYSRAARFAYLSGKLSINLPNQLLGFFASVRQASRENPVSRIEIFPGSVTVRQGEQVNFAAVGYDTLDAPVGGGSFRWQIADTGRRLPARPLNNGRFEARVIGTFTVTAESDGKQAQAVITVLPSEAGSPLQPNLRELTPKTISSRSIQKETEKTETTGSKETSGKDGQSTQPTENILPGEGGWNDGNWGSSDDPGNLPGNPPGQPADGGAGNGNFQISAPIVSLPGRGIDLALNLNYNSRLWNKSGSQLTFDIDRGFPAPGWSLGFGKIQDMGANGGSMLLDADGTRHGFTGSIYPGWGGSSTFVGHTTDGKFIDYFSYRDGNGIYSAQAYFPNGTYIYYGAKADGAVYPIYIRDAQGNYILITYRNNQGPAIQTITDTLGRMITFNYDSNGRLISGEAPRMLNEDPVYGSAGTRTLFKIHYRPLTLAYSFAGVTPVVRNNPVWVIDSIYYPVTNTGYWFGGANANHPDYNGYYSSYGMLTKVEEQRGMSWTSGTEQQGEISAGQMTKRAVYNYPLTTANEAGRTNGISLSDAPTYTTLTESWDGMDVAEPMVTTYSINNYDFHWDGTSNSPARSITITQPNGVTGRQYSYRTPGAWTDGLVFADETIVMNGSTPVVVGSSLVSWQTGEYESPRPSWAEITDENGHKLKTVYSYAGGRFNQITRSCDYGNSSNLIRCTVAQYDNSTQYIGQGSSLGYSGRHIYNLLTAAGIENPDGTRASWIEYQYDNYQNQPLVNTPGVIQHESVSDPYTTETTWVQGECIQWEEHPYGGQYCVDWASYQVSVYDPATEKRGNITKTTTYSDAVGLTGAIYATKGYDITGNLVSTSSACCEQASIQYGIGTQYAYPESQTRGSADPNSPHRITTSSVYDFRTGLIKQTTDANGRTSTMMYHPDTLRPVKTISPPGAYITIADDDTAMTVTEEVKKPNGDLVGKSIKYLNGLGMVKREEMLDVGSVWDIVETKFTKYGEEWKRSRPYRAGETPQFTEKFYDSQGRIIKLVEPDGSETKAFYDRTQYPDSATLQAGSLPPGNTIRMVDAWGRERWARYDQQGRLAEVVEPNPSGNGSVLAAGSLVTKYTYNTLGGLIKTEQGSQIREFKYDSLGKLTRQKLAEQTATLNDAGQYVGAGNAAAKWGESFWYDGRSNLSLKVDARGAKTYFSYQINGVDDPLNRLQSRIYDISGPHDPNQTIHAAPAVTYSYMASGDKTRISQIRTHGFLTEDFTYDPEGRVSDYTQTVDYRPNYPMTVSYLYDSLDRTTEVHYPAQYGVFGSPRKVVEHFYGTASRLSSLKVGGTEVAGNIAYNADGQTTSIKIGPAGANQVTETYSYDSQRGFLTNQKVQKSGQTLLDLSYDYNRNNSAGNLSGRTGHLTKIINNLDANKNREYEFDTIGRLTKAKGGNSLWQQLYAYDRYGNRTSVTASGTAANSSPIPTDGIPNLSYNQTNNRITSPGFEYDSAGNQTRGLAEDGVTWLRFQYDAANRLQIVARDDGTYLQAFQYGSTNARLMDMDYAYGYLKIFASVAGRVLAEYTEFAATVPTWSKSYIYLGDSQLSTITPTRKWSAEYTEYNHPDRLGTRVITAQATGGNFEQTHLPFGTALNAESTVTTNSQRFTSYERSAVSGLDYAINRQYASKQGRFTQVDPIGMSAVSLAAPQTLNLYSYCNNDPVNYTDSLGLFFGKLFKWIGKIFKVINKILKWVIVAVAVVAVAIAIFHSGGAALGFLKVILGIVGKLLGVKLSASVSIITNFAGEVVGSAIVTSISVGLSGQVIAGLYAVGAIASNFGEKPLSGPSLKKYTIAKNALLALLRNADSLCYKFLKGAGFDPEKIAKNLEKQTPYDGLTSTNDAGLDFGDSGSSVAKHFKMLKNGSTATPKRYPNAATGNTGNIYYTQSGLNMQVILHENIHSTFESATDEWNIYDPKNPASDPTTGVRKLGKARMSDAEIQKGMGIKQQADTTNIDEKLKNEGCK